MININTVYLRQFNPFEFTQSLSTAVRKFKDEHSHLPMFRLQANLDKVLVHRHLAEKTKERFTDIVLLGTGGSSLGAQVLCKLSRLEDDIRIHFFDNIDPLTFKHFWEKSRL
ncbi:MAG: hypothetical protein Q8R43_01585, partial [Alphaproteobacteria bacterium]|nr:hypothetical protein [Alphaproteobacteria bacterium]